MTLPRPHAFSSTTALMRWMVHLATRLLARILHMPEPLVHSTGVFVFARVALIENSVGKTLCPMRLLRQLQIRFRQPAR